ncbi:type I methionyl aminopeptidase [Paracidobacterium acidisoli]|uniref:Methionine aminopeptidase n=1 Tax=Paracidobacterium acidisoli TaxID=2303751 RepID=A0A372IPC8_9BACT|nr:type I methionyl aminopeptidase [Paracidobacterium acidisoli]MBT9330891.1 type I methionyl aminopeptidase [Paracidobacterium acidisoli]
MAIMIKTPQEIEKMRRSGQVVREVLEHVRSLVKPGTTTQDLENAAAEKMRELGARPAFKGYRGYPCVLCTSINSEVVHGIPSANRVLREGDIVSIDTGVVIDGYYGDSATTIAVGEKIAPRTKKLLEVTQASLERAIGEVKAGATLGDVGAAVQEVVEAEGFSVVREFVGHGIGTRLHEDPQVPNYGRRGQGQKLREGMVLAIEPMVNVGRPGVQVLEDGWTAVTEDGSLSAHFEHTVAVTAEGALVLT